MSTLRAPAAPTNDGVAATQPRAVDPSGPSPMTAFDGAPPRDSTANVASGLSVSISRSGVATAPVGVADAAAKSHHPLQTTTDQTRRPTLDERSQQQPPASQQSKNEKADLQMVTIHFASTDDTNATVDDDAAAASATPTADRCETEMAPPTKLLSSTGDGYVSIHIPQRLRSYRWDSLPAELLGLICEFADAESLCRLARLDTFTRSVADRPRYWHPLFNRRWLASTSPYQLNLITVKAEDAKRLYGEWFSKEFTAYKEQMEYNAALGMLGDQNRRSWWCHCFSDGLLLPIVALLVVVFIVLLVVQLTQSESVTIAPFIPLFIIGGILAPIACFLACKRWYLEDDGGFVAADHYTTSNSCVKNVMELVGDSESPIAHTSFCGMLLALMLFIVLLSMRVTDRIDWSWWRVFAPLYAVIVTCGFGPVLQWPPRDRYLPADFYSSADRFRQFLFMWLAFIGPLLAFTVLLNVRLDGVAEVRLSVVFAPLFFTDLWAIRVGVQHRYMALWGGARRYVAYAWIFVTIPLIVFKALLLARLEGGDNISFGIIFLPIYLTMICALVAAVCIGSTEAPYPWNQPTLLPTTRPQI